MKSILAFGPIVAVVAVTAAAHPAHSSDIRSASSQETVIHSDLSAQKKKKKKVLTRHRWREPAGYPAYSSDPRSPYYLRPGVAPSFGYIGPPGYAGEYAWRRSIGQCVEDLGYGRWAACGSR